MKKFLLLFLALLTTCAAFANPARGLRAIHLNPAAFTVPLDVALTRQPFVQLQASRQLAAFPQAERTLLLTHKFTTEYNRFPRTVIAENGQLIPYTQYTPAQMQEVHLANSVRYMLRKNSPTPPLIREELENLKNHYAPHRNYLFMLEQLNRWLSTHPWPRETIVHEGRSLTQEEEAEIELATYFNNVLNGRRTSIPAELIEHLRYIRAYYDPSYDAVQSQPVPQEPTSVSEETHGPLFPPKQTKNFYVSSSLPLDPSTGRQQVLPNPTIAENKTAPLPATTVKKITMRLLTFLIDNNQWPAALPKNKSLGKCTLSEMQQDIFYQNVTQVQQEYPGLINLIYTTWKDKGAAGLQVIFAKFDRNEIQYIQETLLKEIELTGPYPPITSLTYQLENWSPDPSYDCVDPLNTWILCHSRWPEQLAWQPPYTKNMYEEIMLAKQIDWYVQNHSPKTEKSQTTAAILSAPTVYTNPKLEHLRQMYQQWHKSFSPE